ncbi:MAG: hypothetical protein RR472_04830 [Anaerovoracaceae bacterium]
MTSEAKRRTEWKGRTRMEINIKELMPIEAVMEDLEGMFQKVDELDRVVILKDNRPVYVLLKYQENVDFAKETSSEGMSPSSQEQPEGKWTLKLHEAMAQVLEEIPDRTLSAKELSDEIYARGLYRKKNGEQAMANQVRARCNNYNLLFEGKKKNFIRLREREEIGSLENLHNKLLQEGGLDSLNGKKGVYRIYLDEAQALTLSGENALGQYVETLRENRRAKPSTEQEERILLYVGCGEDLQQEIEKLMDLRKPMTVSNEGFFGKAKSVRNFL